MPRLLSDSWSNDIAQPLPPVRVLSPDQVNFHN